MKKYLRNILIIGIALIIGFTMTACPEPDPEPEEHVHNYATFIVKAATCIENGATDRRCSCGATEPNSEAVIPATGIHSYQPLSNAVAATCVSGGSGNEKCRTCPSERAISSQALTPGIVNGVENCDYSGAFIPNPEGRPCMVAGGGGIWLCERNPAHPQKIRSSGAAKIDHEYSNWTDYGSPATCTQAGNESSPCSYGCGTHETRVKNALGHSHTSSTYFTESVSIPSCTAGGVRKSTCDRCFQEAFNYIQPLGHIYTRNASNQPDPKWVTYKHPLCVGSGYEVTDCTRVTIAVYDGTSDDPEIEYPLASRWAQSGCDFKTEYAWTSTYDAVYSGTIPASYTESDALKAELQRTPSLFRKVKELGHDFDWINRSPGTIELQKCVNLQHNESGTPVCGLPAVPGMKGMGGGIIFAYDSTGNGVMLLDNTDGPIANGGSTEYPMVEAKPNSGFPQIVYFEAARVDLATAAVHKWASTWTSVAPRAPKVSALVGEEAVYAGRRNTNLILVTGSGDPNAPAAKESVGYTYENTYYSYTYEYPTTSAPSGVTSLYNRIKSITITNTNRGTYNSTGWFLPSLKELAMLYTYSLDNRQRFIDIGATPMSGRYWSSTQNAADTDTAFTVDYSIPTSEFLNTAIMRSLKNSNQRVRPIMCY
ncbi:MAG: DUF1566 domain-containing protein [Treponema sp.]|nr:DUF1566 domain-containing protein [Treponema sp.]MCL2273083.1 DUF1566 domain-containing protein [Treponema sp.]